MSPPIHMLNPNMQHGGIEKWNLRRCSGLEEWSPHEWDFVVQLLSHIWLFAAPWTAAYQASLSFTISWSLLRFMSIELMMSSNHFILCGPLLCPQSFPASGSFPMNQLFTSGGQSIGASVSTSVLLVNIQGWFPLGLTGLIALIGCLNMWYLFSSFWLTSLCITDYSLHSWWRLTLMTSPSF